MPIEGPDEGAAEPGAEAGPALGLPDGGGDDVVDAPPPLLVDRVPLAVDAPAGAL